LGCEICHWKDLFEGYKILPLHVQNKFDLRKILAFKVLGQQESQFCNSHLGILGKKMPFGCSFHGEAKNILQGGEWCLLPKVAIRVKLVFEVFPTKAIAPLAFNLH